MSPGPGLAQSVRLVPLGGLGEIGLNCMLLAAGRDAVLVDCGLLFPQAEHPGIDYLIPDFSILERLDLTLRGVFLTHGHEDHVGALGFLLRSHPVPVYGTPMTLSLVRPRLTDRYREGCDRLQAVAVGSWVEAGPFRVQFIRMAHSVPGACALGIETPAGRILHSGDFRFAEDPAAARTCDAETLAAWGERGVDLLCCDSTQALEPRAGAAERAVGSVLQELFAQVPGRIYLAGFASNVERIQHVVTAASAAGRVSTLLGRSVTQAVRAARRLGHLRLGPGQLVAEPRARGVPRERLCVILGGSQAEPGSALWRVSHGREPHHRLRPGDHVFLSARRIPGNERAISRMLNRCLRAGAEVHDPATAVIHTSGHPPAPDVGRLFDLVRPRHLLPVHGELRHLRGLARLGGAWGLAPGAVFCVENGQSLELAAGQVALGSKYGVGRTAVEAGEPLGGADALLQTRRRIGRHGVVTALLWQGSGEAGDGPRARVLLSGVLDPDQEAGAAAAAEAELRVRLRRRAGAGASAEELRSEAERVLRRHFRQLGNRRPLVSVAWWAPPG